MNPACPAMQVPAASSTATPQAAGPGFPRDPPSIAARNKSGRAALERLDRATRGGRTGPDAQRGLDVEEAAAVAAGVDDRGLADLLEHLRPHAHVAGLTGAVVDAGEEQAPAGRLQHAHRRQQLGRQPGLELGPLGLQTHDAGARGLGLGLDAAALAGHELALLGDVLLLRLHLGAQLLDLLEVAEDRLLVVADLRLDRVDLLEHRRVLALVLDLHQVVHVFLAPLLEQLQVAAAHAAIALDLGQPVVDRDVFGVALAKARLDLLEAPRRALHDPARRADLVGQLLDPQ